MPHRLFAFACVLLFFIASSVARGGDDAAQKRIVGYLAGWNAPRFLPGNLEANGSAAQLTHINYAFGKIGEDLLAHPGDPQADFVTAVPAAASVDGLADDPENAKSLRGNFNQLRKLKAKHPLLKTLISIGGWTGSSHFSDMALTAESRAAFAASCIDVFIRGNLSPDIHAPGLFDGIDIDWEYPAAPGNTKDFRPQDRENFTALLAELRAQLDAQGKADGRAYLLTIATSANASHIALLDLEHIHPLVDWINLMAYDFHGAWNNITAFHSDLQTASAAVQKYLSRGVPPEKIILGVPFYGHGWTGVPPGPNGAGLGQHSRAAEAQKGDGTDDVGEGEEEASVADYRVLKGLGPGFVEHQRAEDGACWIYNPQKGIFWCYDNPVSLAAKAAYIREQKLGGAMIWELSGDDKDATLLKALAQKLK
jgi:chitinase